MLCCLSLITRLCKLIVLRSSNYHVRSTFFFFLMIRRPPRSTLSSSSAASDVYKRQVSTQSTGTVNPPHHPWLHPSGTCSMEGLPIQPSSGMPGGSLVQSFGLGGMEIDMEMHPSGLIPTLQNVVSTVNLGAKLPLKNIALQARNSEYNPKRFAAVIMRIRDPKTTALIFSSGKMVCTGAKSEEFSKIAARKYARIIQKLGYDVCFKEFKIQNIVGSVDVKFPIRLEGLAFAHGHFSSYEPEIFPGLIYRMQNPKIVPVSYTHLRAHETPEHLVCRLLLEKKKKKKKKL
eukprot:TRINITY_DN17683_c0_g1_i2.p1 TRINITY_DN17683_c0_g1~~TRINITY_DN17683_c0_g1_i2.p1  ORF type:complete len:289 (+),score=68.45 TRINITY_DN17683_c0_g1_i2:30-896(+)